MVIWLVSILGGAPRKLRTHCGSGIGVASQAPLVAFTSENEHELWVMGTDGEDPHKILGSENDFYRVPAWSPTGKRLAFIRQAPSGGSASIETVALDGDAPSQVFHDSSGKLAVLPKDGASLLWLSDGRLLYAQYALSTSADTSDVWEIQADPVTGKPFGKPIQLTHSDGVMYADFSATLDARRLVYDKWHDRADVYVAELKEGGTGLGTPTRLTFSESTNFPFAWTLDSKNILFSSDQSGKFQVFKQGLENDTAQPLFRTLDDNNFGKLTPDGTWILYTFYPHVDPDSRPSQPATARLMRLPTQGGTPEQVMQWSTPEDVAGMDCPTHPGTTCLISRWTDGKPTFYILDPVRGQGKAVATTKLGKSDDLTFALSQDGTHIALTSKGRLPGKVRIVDVKTGSEREIHIPKDWDIAQYCWSANGKVLFLIGRVAEPRPRQYFLGRLSLDEKSQVFLKGPRSWSWIGLQASPDGRHLAFSQQIVDGNAWMLENF